MSCSGMVEVLPKPELDRHEWKEPESDGNFPMTAGNSLDTLKNSVDRSQTWKPRNRPRTVL